MVVLSIPIFLLSLAASACFGFFYLRDRVKRQGVNCYMLSYTQHGLEVTHSDENTVYSLARHAGFCH